MTETALLEAHCPQVECLRPVFASPRRSAKCLECTGVRKFDQKFPSIGDCQNVGLSKERCTASIKAGDGSLEQLP